MNEYFQGLSIFQTFTFREHVDLIGFLDFEIWKASHMLAQGIPLQRQIQADPMWRDSDRPISWMV